MCYNKTMKFNKDTFEIIFFARAGQGAKTAAELIAQTAIREGKHVQAFPSFGPERNGAPMEAFVRISDKAIRIHEPIVDPDVVVILDETLIGFKNVTKNLDERESLIINTVREKKEIAEKLKNFKGNIHPIDAAGISFKIVGQPRPNTAILGKLLQVTEIVKLENLIDEFKRLFEPKIGKELTKKNILAIEKAYDSL